MDFSAFNELDVVLVCGLPACGKTVFSKSVFGISNRKRVNRKEIQRAIFEMTGFGRAWSEKDFTVADENLAKFVERKLIEHLLHAGEKVLVDNSSVTAASRAAYTGLAREAKKTIGAIFLNPSVGRCMDWNRTKGDPVPETVISNLSARMELPKASEGFREVLVLKDY